MPTAGRTTDSNQVFDTTLDELLSAYIASNNQLERAALKNKITKKCLPYVRTLARGLARRRTDPLEDLVQVGCMGLVKALEKYNPLTGNKFKTYATYLITGEIRHYLRDKASLIKAPRQMYELYYRMNQIVQRLTDELGRTPTDLEIADELQCSMDKVKDMGEIERRRNPVSLDEFIVNDGQQSETVYVERLVDEKYTHFLQCQESRLMIEHALHRLKQEHRDVITMTFYDDLSQHEIAEKLQISQMQVSRRLRKALELLQQDFSAIKNEVLSL